MNGIDGYGRDSFYFSFIFLCLLLLGGNVCLGLSISEWREKMRG